MAAAPTGRRLRPTLPDLRAGRTCEPRRCLGAVQMQENPPCSPERKWLSWFAIASVKSRGRAGVAADVRADGRMIDEVVHAANVERPLPGSLRPARQARSPSRHRLRQLPQPGDPGRAQRAIQMCANNGDCWRFRHQVEDSSQSLREDRRAHQCAAKFSGDLAKLRENDAVVMGVFLHAVAHRTEQCIGLGWLANGVRTADCAGNALKEAGDDIAHMEILSAGLNQGDHQCTATTKGEATSLPSSPRDHRTEGSQAARITRQIEEGLRDGAKPIHDRHHIEAVMLGEVMGEAEEREVVVCELLRFISSQGSP